jgi:putative inorganic carbon (HCO3(-)) transporter
MRSAGGRLGWLALCFIPLSVGLGRFWHIYIAPGDGIPYPYRTLAFTLTDALVVLTCVGWVAWRWESGPRWRLPRGTGFVFLTLALLALVAAASIVSAYDRRLAVGVTAELAVLVVFFLAASELMAVFPHRWLRVGVAVAVVGQSLLAGWQAVAQTTAPAGMLFNGWARELTSHDQGASVVILPIVGRWLRSYGSFPHPNILGGFLALSLAVLTLHMDPRRRRLGMAAVAMGLAALLLTFSRAAWLAILLGGVTMLLVAPGRWRAMPNARARLGVTVAAFTLVFFALLRISSLGSLSEQNSIETRAFYNSVASQVISRGSPVGAGNLVVAQQHLLGAASAGSEPAHNVFVIVLAELGPLGLLAWLSIIGSLLFAAWERRAEPRQRAGPLVAVAVLTPLLLFDHYLWTQSAGRILFVWTLTLLTSNAAENDPEMRSVDRFGLTGSARDERLPARAGHDGGRSNSFPYEE